MTAIHAATVCGFIDAGLKLNVGTALLDYLLFSTAFGLNALLVNCCIFWALFFYYYKVLLLIC